MRTVGIVAGSFDPITNGHTWLIEEASRLVDELHIVIGVNPAKKYTFEPSLRKEMIEDVLKDVNMHDTPCSIHYIEKDLLIHFAQGLKVTHIIRGVRSLVDFTYETSLADINRQIDPGIRTVYLTPPPELSSVSSSTVKGLVGFNNWEQIVSQYVHPVVLNHLKKIQ